MSEVKGQARGRALARAGVQGSVTGIVAAMVMAAVEKLEQAVTGRPDSYVPGRTLLTMIGRRPSEADRPVLANHAMHYLTGAGLGALRGVWAATGLRGVRADLAHTIVRLATDQTLENATGAGAPPQTWPRQEQAVDFLHKALYSVVTGRIADRVIPGTLTSQRGVRSH
jgi:hypothetical protein